MPFDVDTLHARGFATLEQAVLRGNRVTADGVDLRLVELTGRAGDAMVCHPWLLHRALTQHLGRPRLQRAARFQRRFGV